jgi:hypothetical protein
MEITQGWPRGGSNEAVVGMVAVVSGAFVAVNVDSLSGVPAAVDVMLAMSKLSGDTVDVDRPAIVLLTHTVASRNSRTEAFVVMLWFWSWLGSVRSPGLFSLIPLIPMGTFRKQHVL